MKYLERELKEHHHYTRQNMFLLVTWYTFFISLNFLAAGWFASQVHGIGHHGGIYTVIIYFIVQLVLSIVGCQFFKDYLRKTNLRIRKLLKKGMKSPMPVKMYESIITLFQITMYTLIALWVSFAAFIAWDDFSLYLF